MTAYQDEMLRHARRQLQEAQDLIVDALDSIRLARSEPEGRVNRRTDAEAAEIEGSPVHWTGDMLRAWPHLRPDAWKTAAPHDPGGERSLWAPPFNWERDGAA